MKKKKETIELEVLDNILNNIVKSAKEDMKMARVLARVEFVSMIAILSLSFFVSGVAYVIALIGGAGAFLFLILIRKRLAIMESSVGTVKFIKHQLAYLEAEKEVKKLIANMKKKLKIKK